MPPMKTKTPTARLRLLACTVLAAPAAWAAGGHHAVDDAGLL